MVHLVALLQPAEDRDRVLDRRLADEHLLEPPFERGVLLDVLAVLVERRRADEAQLAAREQRLDHVARVDRTLGAAGADERVQLVDERDDLAVGLGDLLEHGLEPLLELAAVLRARDHRAEVERDQPLAAQALGHVALDDAPREAFDDRGLADARIADEHRVVLRATRQHLDDAADLLVATDHRVDAALPRVLGEVAPVLLERLVLLFGVVARDPVAAAHALQRLEHGVVGDARSAQQVADTAGDLGHREQEVLGREVFVVERDALVVGGFEEAERVGRERRLTDGRAAHARPLRERARRGAASSVAGATPMRSSTPLHDPFGRRDERAQQVLGRDLGVALLARGGLRRAEGLGGLAGETVRDRVPSGTPPSSRDDVSQLCTTARLGDGTEPHDGARDGAVAPTAVRVDRFDAAPARPAPRARRCGWRASASWSSSSRIRSTPERPTPACVSSWMCCSSAMSRSRVAAAPALRALRLDQTLALVDAQRLRVHAGELRGDRDDVERRVRQAPSVLLRLLTRQRRRANSSARIVGEDGRELLDGFALLVGEVASARARRA